MIEGIENESILQNLYEFLSAHKLAGNSSFWNELSPEQKQEILLAFEESEKEENLKDKESFFSSI